MGITSRSQIYIPHTGTWSVEPQTGEFFKALQKKTLGGFFPKIKLSWNVLQVQIKQIGNAGDQAHFKNKFFSH